MEVACARRIWSRSEKENNLQYTVMLCDGDSKAFDAVVTDAPYGADVSINKEDYVSHVSKRFGKAM